MPKTKNLKPGTKTPVSGQYKNNRTGNEITSTKGKPLPPTPKKNGGYSLTDKTKHKKK